VLIDAEHDSLGSLGWGRDHNGLCTRLEMRCSLFRGLEPSGGFDDDINLQLLPGKEQRIGNRVHGIRFAIDDQGAVSYIYPALVGPGTPCHA